MLIGGTIKGYPVLQSQSLFSFGNAILAWSLKQRNNPDEHYQLCSRGIFDNSGVKDKGHRWETSKLIIMVMYYDIVSIYIPQYTIKAYKRVDKVASFVKIVTMRDTLP